MKRRQLLVGGCAALVGTIARAQAQRRYRLGILGHVSRAQTWGGLEGILDELGRLGYARGVRLEVHERYTVGPRRDAEPDKDAEELARQLVAIPVDVILTEGTPWTKAAQNATKVIPIVTSVGFPVETGFARTLKNPGGNVTGMSQNRAGLLRKQFELLRLLRPGITELANLDGDGSKALADAASEAGIRIVNVPEQGLEKSFEQLKAWHIGTAFSWKTMSREDATLALRYRIGLVSSQIYSVEAGALMGAEADESGEYVRVAGIIDKIFRGQKPGDIPLESAERFVTAVNAKTAAALGLRLTPDIRLRVDRIFE